MKLIRTLALATLIACGGKTAAKPTTQCTDADGDGYGVGADCTGPDCDDASATKFTTRDLYLDADKDGLGTGAPASTCTGAQAPSGKSFVAGDCDDSTASCTTNCSDGDGDGLPACAGDCDDDNPNCDSTCADGDNDSYCTNHDCNDSDASHYADCGLCTDADSDDHGALCDLGDDCDDADADVWATCAVCKDEDQDGRFANCDAYIMRSGPDCDDASLGCQVSCQDQDMDGLRACDGDCNDNGTLCLSDVSAGDNGSGSIATGNGGTVNINSPTIVMLAEKQALPDGTPTFGSAPIGPSLFVVSARETVTVTEAELRPGGYQGIRVEAEGTLVLSGVGNFVFNTSGNVLIAGTVRTTDASSTVTFSASSMGVDFTLSGEIDASARAAGASGNTVNIGTSGAGEFSRVFLLGRVLANGVPGSSTFGGDGGTISAYAQYNIFTTTELIARGGGGIDSGNGGTLNLTTSSTNGRVTLRGDALNAHGGAGLEHGGDGGTISFSGETLTASAGLSVNAFGGNTSSPGGAGGSGGDISMTLTAIGETSHTLPLIQAAGGNSAQGPGGQGGNISISIGSTAEVEPSTPVEGDTLTIKGTLQAKGGNGLDGGDGGTVRVHVGEMDSEIILEGTVDTSGGTGGVSGAGGDAGLMVLGRAHTSTPGQPTATVSTTRLVQRGTLRNNAGAPQTGAAGGSIFVNVALYDYESGTMSATGTGGSCRLRDGATTTGDFEISVTDGDGDTDAGTPYPGHLDDF